jgi:hypothetical protein
LEQIHDELLLARAGEVVFPGESNSTIATGLDARTTQAAFCKIEPVIGDHFAFRTLRLGPFNGNTVTGARFFAKLAYKAFRLSCGRITDQFDMATESSWDFQRLMRVMNRDGGFEELAQRYSHPDEQALQASVGF